LVIQQKVICLIVGEKKIQKKKKWIYEHTCEISLKNLILKINF
jgi:hypothetical protein